MGSASSPDPTTAPFESGMPRLALRLAVLSRGTLTRCGPSLTLLMGGASSPDRMTAPLELGVLRLVQKPANLMRGIPTQFSLLITRLMSRILSLSLMTTLPVWRTYLYMLPSDAPLVNQCVLFFLRCPTRMIGSGAQTVAYSTGYPTTFVTVFIHMPSWQSLLHLIIILFLPTLTTLPLELHGLKCSSMHLLNLFVAELCLKNVETHVVPLYCRCQKCWHSPVTQLPKKKFSQTWIPLAQSSWAESEWYRYDVQKFSYRLHASFEWNKQVEKFDQVLRRGCALYWLEKANVCGSIHGPCISYLKEGENEPNGCKRQPHSQWPSECGFAANFPKQYSQGVAK